MGAISSQIKTQIKENIKAPRHWPLCGEFTGDRWVPAQMASNAEDVYIWWRHHEQPHDCLLNRLFRRRSKKTSQLRVTGLCEGNSPVSIKFPAQRASNAENASIWWRHHEHLACLCSSWRRYISHWFVKAHLSENILLKLIISVH